jgi:hypothetical protein
MEQLGNTYRFNLPLIIVCIAVELEEVHRIALDAILMELHNHELILEKRQ